MAALSEGSAGPWTPFAKATAPRQCCDVQWCGDTVIAATYDYIEDEGLRRGGLCALAVGGDGALTVRSTLELRGGYAVAVEPGTAQLACATADGRVALAAVGDDGALSLAFASEPRGRLFTSVEWCGDGELTVAEGDSGAVSLWRRAGDGVVEERRWAAHDYGPGCPAEVWCATRGAGLVYSGADDGTLKAWDPRTPGPSRAASLRHDAGVTSVRETFFVPPTDASTRRSSRSRAAASRRAPTTSTCGSGTCGGRARRSRRSASAAGSTRSAATAPARSSPPAWTRASTASSPPTAARWRTPAPTRTTGRWPTAPRGTRRRASSRAAPSTTGRCTCGGTGKFSRGVFGSHVLAHVGREHAFQARGAARVPTEAVRANSNRLSNRREFLAEDDAALFRNIPTACLFQLLHRSSRLLIPVHLAPLKAPTPPRSVAAQ